MKISVAQIFALYQSNLKLQRYMDGIPQNIIHSYWSLPSLTYSDDENARNKGGWLEEKYHAMSWALSCLRWKAVYGNIKLYTDKAGSEWLLDKLLIPYNEVEVNLDILNTYSPDLWALPKVYVYGLQEAPFLHTDGDVFIWDKMPFDINKTSLFCQHMEYNFSFYEPALADINALFDFVPQEFKNVTRDNFACINAGVLGGNDIPFFKELAAKAFEFIDRNSNCLEKTKIGTLNVIFEQFLFSQMKKDNLQVVFDYISPNFKELMRFNLCPFQTKYIHLIGYGKKSINSCIQVEERLKYEFPKIYNHIKSVYSNTATSARANKSGEAITEPQSPTKLLMADVAALSQAMKELSHPPGGNDYLDILYSEDSQKLYDVIFKLNDNCDFVELHHDFPNHFSFVNTQFILENQETLAEVDMADYMIYKDLNHNFVLEKVEGWNTLLLFFAEEGQTVNQLFDKIQSSNMMSHTGENLKFDLLNFVTINYLFKRILDA